MEIETRNPLPVTTTKLLLNYVSVLNECLRYG
jgi:hypothetical protein